MTLGRDDVRSAEVVAAAVDRLQALAKLVARLTIGLPELAPPDAEVRIDGRVVARAALDEAIVLDPGPHIVTATAKEATPFRSEIVLPKGAQGSLTISLEPPPHPPSGAVLPAPASAPPTEVHVTPGRTAGWIAVAGGGALLIGSTVLLLVRQAEISKLNSVCKEGICPIGSNRSDLESTRSRALVEGPAAIALGVAGVVAASVGAYFLITAQDGSPNSHAPGTRIVPMFAWGAGGIAVAGGFR
jgi:hypothetical protein